MPANHPLFLGQSLAELELEFYTDLLLERNQLQSQIDKDDLDGKALDAAYARVNTIGEVFGYKSTSSDPLIDKWERELAEGKTPDFDEVYDG